MPALSKGPTDLTTNLISIDQEQPAPEAIEQAAAIIRRGGLVAAPTDALYSIFADPYSVMAAEHVFKAKGRQANRSLPLVVDNAFMAEDLMKETSKRFQVLARKYWPGPLTIIVPAAAQVPLKVTGNTGRLALRQSPSLVVNALIEALQQPLICTSANISGQPTCRAGIEAFAVLDGRVELVLDGGSCSGPGATTIDITEPYWKVIREGAIEEREIRELLKATGTH